MVRAQRSTVGYVVTQWVQVTGGRGPSHPILSYPAYPILIMATSLAERVDDGDDLICVPKPLCRVIYLL